MPPSPHPTAAFALRPGCGIIRSRGATRVLSMLKENRTLTSINLLSNRIDRRERIKILEAAGERVAVAIETDQDL